MTATSSFISPPSWIGLIGFSFRLSHPGWAASVTQITDFRMGPRLGPRSRGARAATLDLPRGVCGAGQEAES